MAKDFRGALSRNQGNKQAANEKTEISILRDRLAENRSNAISLVPLQDIKLAKNIRNTISNPDYEEISSLADDIEEKGLLQPVLITKDKYLIAGSRRYLAVCELYRADRGPREIMTFTYQKELSEIDSVELSDIQMSENEQRRQIDNFQLSQLYNYLLENGLKQKDIEEKFKKSKGFVSRVIQIKNIDYELQKFLKEFQVWGWSEKKFHAGNFSESMDEKERKEYEKLRGIIGINPLYSIAQGETTEEQKRKFLRLFRKRLDIEELNSEFFAGCKEEKKEVSPAEKLLKKYENLGKEASDLMYSLPEEQQKIGEEIKKLSEKIKNLLKKLESK